MNSRQIQIIGFDVDGTLSSHNFWQEITVAFGLGVETVLEVYRKVRLGELTTVEATQQVLMLWQGSGKAKKSYMQQVFHGWELYPNASEVIEKLKAKGYQIVIISGAADLYVQSVAERLNVIYWYANTDLEWENDDLVGMRYRPDQAVYKVEQLRAHLATVGKDMSNCVFVGDGWNDRDLFKETGHGVLLKSVNYDRELEKLAWREIDVLGDLVKLL